MGCTSDLVSFIYETGYEEIPREVVDRVKLHILDCIGVTLAAIDKPITKMIADQARQEAGKPQSTVIGLGLKVPCATAAWANGTIGHSLDFDDNSIALPTAIHQTVTTLPAALSVGELVDAHGRKLLEAIILGIEAESKVDRAMGGHRDAWHGTGTFGSIGSAVAAAKLLELNKEQLEYAIGIACSTAAGLVANFGTMTKPLHAGQASRNGVVAALLAKNGFTSARGILESKEGFADVTGNKLERSYLKEHLGNPWEVLDPGIHIKMYPSCMATHAGLDAIIRLAKSYQIDPSNVEYIEVRSGRDVRKALLYDRPKTGLEGKFSMQFCIAIGLLKRRATLEEFSDETVRDPVVTSLTEKVKLVVDENLAKKGPLATIVKVKMKDGRSLQESVDSPKGSKNNPVSAEEVAQKFRDCASHALKEKAGNVIDMVLKLETVDKISTLTELLVTVNPRNEHFPHT